MKKINPNKKADKDEEHITLAVSNKTVMIQIGEGDNVTKRIYVTVDEMDEIVKEYRKLKT